MNNSGVQVAELQYNYMPVPVSKYMNSVHIGSLD